MTSPGEEHPKRTRRGRWRAIALIAIGLVLADWLVVGPIRGEAGAVAQVVAYGGNVDWINEQGLAPVPPFWSVRISYHLGEGGSVRTIWVEPLSGLTIAFPDQGGG